MTSDEAGRIAQQIWDGTPREDAYVWLVIEDKLPDEKLGHCYRVEGNRSGLLRFAAEILKAVESGGGTCDYLFHSKPGLISVVRTETSEPPAFEAAPKPLKPWQKQLTRLGCLALVLFGLVCMIVGLVTIVGKAL